MACHDCGNEPETSLEGQPLCMACVESMERGEDVFREFAELSRINEVMAFNRAPPGILDASERN